VESSRMIGDIYHFLLQEALSHSCVGPRDELVRRIIRQMETACERPWCLQDISKAHFVSVPQLIRRFKTETGKTPYAYLMALRLQTAETYLRYTKHSISEICHMTGFTSTSNFIQQFQKAYGTTPSRYRESK